eukprot:1891383-Amphidinium_carterae.1
MMSLYCQKQLLEALEVRVVSYCLLFACSATKSEITSDCTSERERGPSLSVIFICKVSLDFNTDILALKGLCRKCSWSLAWYELESSGRPLPRLSPNVVSVQPCAGFLEVAFWPVLRKKRAKKVQPGTSTGTALKQPMEQSADQSGDEFKGSDSDLGSASEHENDENSDLDSDFWQD